MDMGSLALDGNEADLGGEWCGRLGEAESLQHAAHRFGQYSHVGPGVVALVFRRRYAQSLLDRIQAVGVFTGPESAR